MISREDVYRIGRLGKPHGVRGELVFFFDDDVFDRTDADYVFLDIDGLLVPYFFDEYRFRNDTTALVTFEDVDSADRAAELTGCEVWFPRRKAGEAGDAPSLAEVVGYEVEGAGVVVAVDDTTANVLFHVRRPDGSEVLLPAALVEDVDTARHRLFMHIPDGLLDL